MSLHPSKSRRTRAFNIFVIGFFLATWWAMLVAGIIAEGSMTIAEILSRVAGTVLVTVAGVIAAVFYYRGGNRS